MLAQPNADGGGFHRRGKRPEQPATPEAPVSLRELLATNKPYRQLYVSNAVSGLGDSIQQSAMPLLTLSLTGSPMAAGLTAFALWTPTILFELPAGYVADFYDREKTMWIAQWAGLTAAAAAWAAVGLGVPDIGTVLVGTTLVEGTAARFYLRSLRGAVRDLVSPAQLPQANRLTEIEKYVAGTGGRALGTVGAVPARHIAR